MDVAKILAALEQQGQPTDCELDPSSRKAHGSRVDDLGKKQAASILETHREAQSLVRGSETLASRIRSCVTALRSSLISAQSSRMAGCDA